MAALRALARGGVPAVSVEALARELGATRGSFYWHFAHRDALLEAALGRWEREGTTAVIAEVSSEPDPRERLRRLIVTAVALDPVAGLEPSLTAQADHPALAPVLRRVTRARLDFLTRCYRDLGAAPALARRRAVVAYAAYLGWLDLRQIAGDEVPETASDGRVARVAVQQLLDQLIPPA
jgi:AcrR family transcriptional regulator